MIKYKILFLLLTCSNLVTAQEEIIFEENFIDNRNNWHNTPNDSLDSEKSSYIIENSKYIVTNRNNDKTWYTTIPLEIDQSRDFIIETEFLSIYHSDSIYGVGQGIMWGSDGWANSNDFSILTNLPFYYKNEWKDSSFSYLPRGRAYGIINKDSPNKIRIEKINDFNYYYINNNFVCKLFAAKLYGNEIGFVLYENSTMEINYLKVSYSNVERDKPPTKPLSGIDFTRVGHSFETIIEDLPLVVYERFSDKSFMWSYSGTNVVYYYFDDNNVCNKQKFLYEIDKYEELIKLLTQHERALQISELVFLFFREDNTYRYTLIINDNETFFVSVEFDIS